MAELVEVDVVKNKTFVVGDEIKLISEIQECDKPVFVDLTEAALMGMFKDLAKVDDNGEIEPEPLGSEYDLNEIYNAEWYAERFPGFTPEEYWFMSQAAKEENKILDSIEDAKDTLEKLD